MAPSINRPELPKEIFVEVHRIEHFQLIRILIFLCLFMCGALGAVNVVQAFDGALGMLAATPFYLLAAASLHGISLFTHEGVHGLISRHSGINDVISSVCAWPVLQTFAAYRVLHLRHHRQLGVEGDPDHYANYTARKGMVFLMHWGRLIFGYPVYITFIPLLGLWRGSWRDRFQIVMELLCVISIFTWVLMSDIDQNWLIHGWLCPMGLIHFMVNIRGMSQHTLLEHAADEVLGTRTIMTNPVTQYFMCNENFHLEHHVYPGVPWYHLPTVHRVLKPELISRGAPLIPSYSHFVRSFVSASFTRRPSGSVDLSHL